MDLQDTHRVGEHQGIQLESLDTIGKRSYLYDRLARLEQAVDFALGALETTQVSEVIAKVRNLWDRLEHALTEQKYRNKGLSPEDIKQEAEQTRIDRATSKLQTLDVTSPEIAHKLVGFRVEILGPILR